MANQEIPRELAEALREGQASIPELRDIAQLYVSRFAEDASSAIGNGAVLLGISTINDDEDGDGFRFLIGLPRGTEITGYLTNYFAGYVGGIA